MTREIWEHDKFHELAATLTEFAGRLHGLGKRVKDEADGDVYVNMGTLIHLINDKVDDRMDKIEKEVDSAIKAHKKGAKADKKP